MLAIVAASAPASLGARTAPPRAAVPGTGCEVFPADNAWNMDVSKLPRHRRSDVWKKAMHAGTTKLHPDFGPPAYGIPFDVVDGSATGFVDIDFVYAEESDPGPYPFSGSTPIEGGSDHHALTIDSETCVLYELFAAQWSGGDPRAGSGAIFDLDSNKLRPAEWTSADAAGLPIFPGLVRYDEVMAGRIGHAIRVTADCTSRRYLWPARHQAGSPDTRCPPMGARFRLKKGFSMAGYSRERENHPEGVQALRAHRRRQRQGLVLPGCRRRPVDQRADVPAETHPRGCVRRRGHLQVQGRSGQRALRLRAGLPRARQA